MSEPSHQFVLILQEQDGNVDVAGVQKPEEFDGNSPVHVFGRWLQDNIQDLIVQAIALHKQAQDKQAQDIELDLKSFAEHQEAQLSLFADRDPEIICNRPARLVCPVRPVDVHLSDEESDVP